MDIRCSSPSLLFTVVTRNSESSVLTSERQLTSTSGTQLGETIFSLTDDVEDFNLELGKLFDELSRDMSPDELDMTQNLGDFIAKGCTSSNCEFSKKLADYASGQSTGTVEERVKVAEGLLDSIQNSDFLQNLRTSATVNLPSVLALTVLRSVVEVSISESLSGSAAVAVGATFTTIPLLLAAGAFAHHEVTRNATFNSRASQLSLIAGAGLILAAAVFTNPVSIFSTIAKSAPGLMGYCLARDGFASVHNMRSDTALNLRAQGLGSVVYGLQQFIAEAVGIAMGPGWGTAIVKAIINAGIESGEPAVNEKLSALMPQLSVAQDVEAQQSVDDTPENHLKLDWKIPGWRDLLGRMVDAGVPRVIAFSIISTGATVGDYLLGIAGLTDQQREWTGAVIVGILAGLIITPFYHSQDRPKSNPTLPPRPSDVGSGMPGGTPFTFD